MKQILIVEDDSFLNKMLTYNLTADGYGVTSALNARTAADAIRQREFDLVLLDVNLPDGNGFELCRLIKPQHPDTIIIFLTANDQESDQIRGYEVGAVDYITKPFVIRALQRKIKAMFAMLEHHKPREFWIFLTYLLTYPYNPCTHLHYWYQLPLAMIKADRLVCSLLHIIFCNIVLQTFWLCSCLHSRQMLHKPTVCYSSAASYPSWYA